MRDDSLTDELTMILLVEWKKLLFAISQAGPIWGKSLPILGKCSPRVVLNLAIRKCQSPGTLHCSASGGRPRHHKHDAYTCNVYPHVSSILTTGWMFSSVNRCGVVLSHVNSQPVSPPPLPSKAAPSNRPPNFPPSFDTPLQCSSVTLS